MMTGGGSALCSGGGGGGPTSSSSSIVSLSIRSEIHRFESVHPSIYSIYELLEQVQDSSVAQAIREHVVNIEDCFVNSQEWTLSRSVSDLHVGLLGSQMSPKSTLVHRYLTNQYVQDNSPEGGRFKKEIIVNSTPYLLLLRDEGGPPELQFSHWTDAIILVASSTQTTNTCFSYLTRFANYRSLNDVPIVLVSVEEHANASLEFIKEFKKIPHSGYFHVNVRTGVNVEQLFSEVCNMIVNKRTSMGPPPPPPSSLQRSNSSLSDKNITPVCTPTSSRKFRRRSNLFKSATQDLGSGRAIPVKQGCLLKKSNNSNSKITNKKWKKKYVTMSEGKIEYFDNLNAYMDNPNSGKVIDLKHVTVKLTRSAGHHVRTITDSLSTLSLKKQSSYNMHAANAGVEAYGFQLVSISKTWDFESTSKADRDEWVELIEEQIVKSLQANVADRVSSRKNEGACDEEILVVKNLNGVCADCGVQLSKGGGYWASLNLCVVVCIACSGVHRNIGTHISKIRSMELDEMSSLLISPLRSIESNGNANRIYEACVPDHAKPGASCSDIERSSYIRRKYEHLEFLPAEPKSVNQDMVAKSIIDKDFFTFLLYVNISRRSGDALFVDGKLLNVAISNEFIAAAQIILWMTNDGVGGGGVTPSCTPDRKPGFNNAQYYGNVGSPSELPCGVSSKVNLASASKLLNNNNNASNASSVRIRNSNGARKKKQADKKHRLFVNSNNPINDEPERDNTPANNPTPGRITGSSSIETLVRVGIEKEAGIPPEARNMVVLHDFTPCVDDELEVKRGSVVSILYRENDWVYVILEHLPNGAIPEESSGNREGFIPFSYCAPYGSPVAEIALGGKSNPHASVSHNSFDSNSQKSGNSNTQVPFYKDPSPTRYIALYKFTARDENDVNVERGELLTVLNKDDPDWFYVVRSDGQEGFVPSAFVYPLTQQNNNQPTYTQIQDDPRAFDTTGSSPSTSEMSNAQQYGTELVMLYDYKAQAPDDLSVRRGDWVYADLLHQTVEGWLWALAPKQRKYGFIPKAYARPPAMTSL